jgi:glutamine amidotransferase
MFGFLANRPVPLAYPILEATNALVKQSKKDSRGYDHSDGWGMAYYHDGEAVVHKNVLPAFKDVAFREHAQKISATTAIAHVRAASVGNITLQNTHSFRYQNWVWAHNGTVRPFEEIRGRFTRQVNPAFLPYRLGETDSELCFMLFLTELAKHEPFDLNRPEAQT